MLCGAFLTVELRARGGPQCIGNRGVATMTASSSTGAKSDINGLCTRVRANNGDVK
jgi:hypothetical protein